MVKHFVLVAALAFVIYKMTDEDPFKPDMVRGLRVVVTGASTGIGEQLAYQYASMGAHLVITARRENLLKEVLEKCRKLGQPDTIMDYIAADMSSESDAKKVIQNAVKTLGGIDQLLINHAFYDTFDEWRGSSQNMEDLHKYFKVNFFSHVQLWSEALPHLLKNEKASVGVVSSLTGKIPTPFHASYSATKFALDGFFGSMRMEMRETKKNISITLHVIGIIDTQHGRKEIEAFVSKFGLDEDMWDYWFPAADAGNCAHQIIRSTTLEEKEHYFPETQMIGLQVKMRHLFPWIYDYVTLDTFKKKV